jgi:Uma2 family endonuclease
MLGYGLKRPNPTYRGLLQRMANRADKAATYADLEAVPPHLVAEIIFGTLITHPRPVRRHGGAASALGALSTNAYQFGVGGPGGWIFVDEPELHLGPHVCVPDIAGWRSERMTESPDKPHFEIAPSWICEILSPSTEKYDKGDKRRIYATYGVEDLWFVDPRSRNSEVFHRQDKDWLLTHTFFDNDDVNAPPFDALTFKLGLLWPFDPPTEAVPQA